MILVHFKVLMLSQSEEPHRIFDHDAQPARTDHHTQTGHLPRRQTQGHDVQRALRAQRAGRTSCRPVDKREQRESSKMMCETSWGVPESKRASCLHAEGKGVNLKRKADADCAKEATGKPASREHLRR